MKISSIFIGLMMAVVASSTPKLNLLAGPEVAELLRSQQMYRSQQIPFYSPYAPYPPMGFYPAYAMRYAPYPGVPVAPLPTPIATAPQLAAPQEETVSTRSDFLLDNLLSDDEALEKLAALKKQYESSDEFGRSLISSITIASNLNSITIKTTSFLSLLSSLSSLASALSSSASSSLSALSSTISSNLSALSSTKSSIIQAIIPTINVGSTTFSIALPTISIG